MCPFPLIVRGLQVSARNANQNTGVAFIYTRASTSVPWIVAATLNPGLSGSTFGRQVVISGDGGTVVVGASTYNSDEGAVFVYIRSGSTWSASPSGTLLTTSAPYVSAANKLGIDVSISSDGLIIAGEWNTTHRDFSRIGCWRKLEIDITLPLYVTVP